MNKEYYQKNKEHLRTVARAYYLKNKDKIRAKQKVLNKKRIAMLKAQNLCIGCKSPTENYVWCKVCRDKHKKYQMTKEQRLQRKVECFEAYGGAFCRCCGESELSFLSIDHINNDGASHRKIMWPTPQKRIGGGNIYSWLIARNFPSGFQVLCHNCNMGKHINGGICPHKGTNS